MDALLIERVLPIIEEVGLQPTWTEVLNRIGAKLFGDSYLGAFPPVRQPRRPKKGDMWLWNTVNVGGEHWGATIVLQNGRRLSYDSYGRNLQLIRERKDMKRKDFSHHSWSDNDAEQSKTSAICGPLSLAWLTIAKENPDLAREI